ncbi:MAG: hypothetical protein ACYDAY_09735 [Candidatus Dormibacteria bacterium]
MSAADHAAHAAADRARSVAATAAGSTRSAAARLLAALSLLEEGPAPGAALEVLGSDQSLSDDAVWARLASDSGGLAAAGDLTPLAEIWLAVRAMDTARLSAALERAALEAESASGTGAAPSRSLLSAIESSLAALELGDDPMGIARAEALSRPAQSLLVDPDPDLAARAWLALRSVSRHRPLTLEAPAELVARWVAAATDGPGGFTAARALLQPRFEDVRVSVVGNPSDPRAQELLRPLRGIIWPGLTLVPLHCLIGTHFANSELHPEPMAIVESGSTVRVPARSHHELLEVLATVSTAPGWLRQLETFAAG